MSRVLPGLVLAVLMTAAIAVAQDGGLETPTGWQSPPEDVLEILHAPRLPWGVGRARWRALAACRSSDVSPPGRVGGAVRLRRDSLHAFDGARADPGKDHGHS